MKKSSGLAFLRSLESYASKDPDVFPGTAVTKVVNALFQSIEVPKDEGMFSISIVVRSGRHTETIPLEDCDDRRLEHLRSTAKAEKELRSLSNDDAEQEIRKQLALDCNALRSIYRAWKNNPGGNPFRALMSLPDKELRDFRWRWKKHIAAVIAEEPPSYPEDFVHGVLKREGLYRHLLPPALTIKRHFFSQGGKIPIASRGRPPGKRSPTTSLP